MLMRPIIKKCRVYFILWSEKNILVNKNKTWQEIKFYKKKKIEIADYGKQFFML